MQASANMVLVLAESTNEDAPANIIYESTSAIGTKKLLIACRFFDNDKYEHSKIE